MIPTFFVSAVEQDTKVGYIFLHTEFTLRAVIRS